MYHTNGSHGGNVLRNISVLSCKRISSAKAEKSQQLSGCMEMGYAHPIPEGTFYNSIGWKSTGIIATSYYGEADYSRSFCTPSGNQTVVWVACLLLKLYKYTGREIYAKRAIAGMRQVMK